MGKRRVRISLLAGFFIFLFCIFPVQAEVQDTMLMNLITMVYSITPLEDIPEVNFLAYIPIITDDSIPVFLKLSDESQFNSDVSGFSFKTIKGDGTLIRLTLKNCKKEVKSYLAFEVYTLKKQSLYLDLPAFVSLASYSGLSEELRKYTQSSLTIQSSAPLIRAKAYDILYSCWTGNVREVLEKIINFTAKKIKFKAFGDQTALMTLSLGYAVCTGKANLAVALARALGIPARILAVLASHFIVDFWIPDYGWVRGESTEGKFPDSKHVWTVNWIADIEDENLFGPSGGVIAYLGFEEEYNAHWIPEYDEIAHPERWIENFATVDGSPSLNDLLFEKGAELWRLFCDVKNSALQETQTFPFYSFQWEYFQSLTRNDIQNALNWAGLAIAEAKRILNRGESGSDEKIDKDKEKNSEKTRFPSRFSLPF